MNKKQLTTLIAILIAIGLIVLYFNLDTKNKDVPIGEEVTDVTFEEVEDSEDTTPKVDPSVQDQINMLFVSSGEARLAGNYIKAKMDLEKAMALDPKNPSIMQTYASLLLVIDDAAGAEAWVDQSLAIRPADVSTWFLKFDIVKKRTNNSVTAMKAVYHDALEALPNEIDIFTSFARYLGDNGDTQGAILYWEKAKEYRPSASAIYDAEIKALKN